MNISNAKNDLDKIDKKLFDKNSNRYELRDGNANNAPNCPYGNKYKWLGYDKMENKYVRFTKSVFKILILLCLNGLT